MSLCFPTGMILLGLACEKGDPPLAPEPEPATGQGPTEQPKPFHLVEASIDDIHGALSRSELSCVALTKLYFARIKAYSGHCVAYDKNGDGAGPDYDFAMPSGKGIYLGVVEPLENAGKVNAIQNVNLRPANYSALGFAPPHDPGPRSETDLVDSDPKLPDALEVAVALDREYASSKLLRPLHCVPIVIKDQMDTADMRTTDGSLTQFVNDRPASDGTLVKKLKDAGAIIIAKANMDEYAGGTHRSSYGGHVCNPYATNRDSGSSSTGSAAAPAINLAVCGIAEESLGSIREPGKKSGLVAMAPTRGLVSRHGTWAANLLRERFGPICRNVSDLAKVLDAIKGYDALDPVTATQVGMLKSEPLATHAYQKSMAGKRLGIVREFMPSITVNDAESVRVFNEEVIPTLRKAGAELVESINARDIAKGWSVDDPNIPNIDIQSIVAQMVPLWEPSFANASTLPMPSPSAALLPNNLRPTLAPLPALFPDGTDLIQKSVEMYVGSTPFPAEISLRKLNETPAGSYNEGRFGLDLMLAKRGDPRVRSVLDLSIDFQDLDGDGDAAEHITFARIGDDVMGSVVLRNRPGVEPNIGVPAVASGLTLDTQGQAGHVFRQQAIREIVARIMAEYNLDALVYPYETIPAKIMSGTRESIAWLSYDGRPNRGYNGFTDVSGLPDIGVPAGFTRVVYDRTTRGMATEELALSPPSLRREVMLPFSVQFLGRPWSEPLLLEIASAYELARGPRTPPPGFGPLAGEP
jgi:Asp-tRNA(Asn)/Glu-tRNA(Gln) amidotransferase A subunit family amidase